MQTEMNAVFLQTLTGAILDLKNRLQQDYEQAYPGLGNVVRVVLDEAEERCPIWWKRTWSVSVCNLCP